MGHPEYDRVTLDGEYKRDLSKGLPIDMPKNYIRMMIRSRSRLSHGDVMRIHSNAN